MERQGFQCLLVRQRRQHGVLSADMERRGRIASQQRIETGASEFDIPIEADHVFRQLRQRNLRLQDVLLRNFPHCVLDSRCLDGLARNGDMLLVDPQFVVGKQHVIERFVDAYANIQPRLLQLRLRFGHIGLGHAGAQPPLARPRQRLGDTEHVLRVVEVPRLLQGYSPSAIHRDWIVERAGSGNMRFCDGNSSDGHLDLRISGESDLFHFVQG